MRDLCIIGAGIVGSALAYEASRYDIDVVVLERELDIALGTSRANHAVIYAGYEAKPNTRIARYTVASAQQMPALSERLGFEYNNCGSMLLAFNDEEIEILESYYQRGLENGVEEMRLLDREEAVAIEPQLSQDVKKVLYAAQSGVVNPWDYVLAFSQVALREGVDFFLDREVLGLIRHEDYYEIETSKGVIEARYVINAAGKSSPEIHAMVSDSELDLYSIKSNFYMLEAEDPPLLSSILFCCPDSHGRSLLAAPTIHGRYVLGESFELSRRCPRDQRPMERKQLFKHIEALAPQFNHDFKYRCFAGERLASKSCKDFVLGFIDDNFYDCAAICSPGLSAAPILARETIELLLEERLHIKPKENWDGRRSPRRPQDIRRDLAREAELDEAFFEKIIARSEDVSAEEIIAAIEQGMHISSLEWVKPREGVEAGSCRGGLCSLD
ncbi:MAG: FAD-dependent oxidoreductase [Eubacteriales bacterium]|nr:FAD-dependent oxidoreductase [Eubacteriales bacterium]